MCSSGPATWLVAIVAYNDYPSVRKAVLAYRQQTAAPGRVLIVDNSDVPQAQHVADLGVDYLSGHSSGQNSGSAGGFAAAMRHARETKAQRLILNDQDAYPAPGMMAALWRLAEKHPDAILAPFTVDPRSDDVMPSYPAVAPRAGVGAPFLSNRQELGRSLGWSVAAPRLHDLDSVRSFLRGTQQTIVRTPLVPPQGMCIPLAVLERIAPFRPEFFVGHEDYEWCCRVHDAGVDILLCPDAVVYHHLAWHRQVVVLGRSLTFPDYDAVRHEHTLRNALTIANERLSGSLRVSWEARHLLKAALYVLFGTGSTRARLDATFRALWQETMRRTRARRYSAPARSTARTKRALPKR